MQEAAELPAGTSSCRIHATCIYGKAASIGKYYNID